MKTLKEMRCSVRFEPEDEARFEQYAQEVAAGDVELIDALKKVYSAGFDQGSMVGRRSARRDFNVPRWR
jgi:hypothetical protein